MGLSPRLEDDLHEYLELQDKKEKFYRASCSPLQIFKVEQGLWLLLVEKNYTTDLTDIPQKSRNS